MKVLYFHQYFVTPDEFGASRSYWFAKKLIENGHKVVMVTARNSHSKRASGRYCIDGIDVIYLNLFYTHTMSSYEKIKAFVGYFFAALLVSFRIKDIKLVYASSTPLTVGLIAMVYKFFTRTNYLFEVRDLWPESPIQNGKIKNKFIISLLRKIEKSIYFHAKHIVALSPDMKDMLVSSGIKTEKITIITNMAKTSMFYPHDKSDEILVKFNISITKFNVIYFGSMSAVNGLEFILKTASILKQLNQTDIQFILAGYGPVEKKLKKFASDNSLDNTTFITKLNTFEISELVNCCTMSIITFVPLPVEATNSPNKLFDSLSAGIPVIVNSNGWTKRLVETENCGFYVDAQKPEELVNKLIEAKGNKNKIVEWGNNSRRLAETVFSQELLCSKFVELIEKQYCY